MKDNREIYISVDIETDGPIPGNNSMLSLGAAAFQFDRNMEAKGCMTACFYRNFHQLEGATPDPSTMKWWSENQEAYEATRKGAKNPKQAIGEFVEWVNSLDGKPVFVGYPATFDFMFVYHYIIHFGYQSPFSFSALDIKSYVSAVLKLPYRESTKKNMPKHWFSDKKHTHVALDDAIEQGELFINILKEHTGK